MTDNGEYYEFYEQTEIYAETDKNIYSSYMVSSYGYANGVWQTDDLFVVIYKKASDTLTDVSDNFLENVKNHRYGKQGKWYYKKEDEWIEITEDLTISSVFSEPCLVEIKVEPNA